MSSYNPFSMIGSYLGAILLAAIYILENKPYIESGFVVIMVIVGFIGGWTLHSFIRKIFGG